MIIIIQRMSFRELTLARVAPRGDSGGRNSSAAAHLPAASCHRAAARGSLRKLMRPPMKAAARPSSLPPGFRSGRGCLRPGGPRRCRWSLRRRRRLGASDPARPRPDLEAARRERSCVGGGWRWASGGGRLQMRRCIGAAAAVRAMARGTATVEARVVARGTATTAATRAGACGTASAAAAATCAACVDYRVDRGAVGGPGGARLRRLLP